MAVGARVTFDWGSIPGPFAQADPNLVLRLKAVVVDNVAVRSGILDGVAVVVALTDTDANVLVAMTTAVVNAALAAGFTLPRANVKFLFSPVNGV